MEKGGCRRRLSPVRISLAYSRDGSRIQQRHAVGRTVVSRRYPVGFVLRSSTKRSNDRALPPVPAGVVQASLDERDTCLRRRTSRVVETLPVKRASRAASERTRKEARAKGEVRTTEDRSGYLYSARDTLG